jgi:uncharacterized repeat protein (TIGR01451 family)
VTDPVPDNNSATDTDTIVSGASVSGTKSVAGTFVPGSTVTYSVVLSNSGTGVQADNPGDEFVDTLPAGLTLTGASATSGTASTTGNIVHWNGSIAAAGNVTITITATIDANASGTIVNQGSIMFDGDGNGSNEATALTDDPNQGGASDGTPFVVVGVDSVPVPTLDRIALFSLMLLMMGVALRRARVA